MQEKNLPTSPAKIIYKGEKSLEKQDFIKYALLYLNKGISVIPISGEGDMKKPPQGFAWKKYQNIMATPAEVQAWADSYPNLNLGIVTGAISGIVVIDIDDRNIADTIDVPKDTPMTITGKGYHVYCKMPKEPIKNSASKIADHVDIRGNGGYVLAPPSMHLSGNQYAWLNDLDTPLADLPQWIIQKYYPTDKKPKETKVKVTTDKEVLGEGSRNDTLFRSACRLRKTGLSEEEVIKGGYKIYTTLNYDYQKVYLFAIVHRVTFYFPPGSKRNRSTRRVFPQSYPCTGHCRHSQRCFSE